MTETTKDGSVKIESTVVGDVTVWAPEGRIDAVTAPGLQQAMTASIDDGARALVLDLSGARYMSSAGLRIVLIMARYLQGMDGNLVVCGLNDEVKELFEVSGFSLIVDILADRDAAVAAVQQTD